MFSEIGDRVAAATVGLAGSMQARKVVGAGAGGDQTVEIDLAAEAAVLEVLDELRAEGAAFSLLSEELGARRFGAEYPLVVVDPIDGSLNAKQGLPFYAVMLALLEGPTLADAKVAYVRDLAGGDRWTAVAGAGVTRNGNRLAEPLPVDVSGGLRNLIMEAGPRHLVRAAGVLARVDKLRIMGSMALSICHTAAGHMDAMYVPHRARLFDMTASLLVLSELGGIATDAAGEPLAKMAVDLETRTTLIASSSREAHRLLLEAASS